MKVRALAALVAALLLVGGEGLVRAEETLDGRAPEEASTGRQVARGVLWVPRGLMRIIAWPVIEVSRVLEEHKVYAHTYEALTSDDHLVGLRPVIRYETGFLLSLGLRFFDKRTLGKGSQLQLTLSTAGSDIAMGEVLVRPPPATSSQFELRASFARRNDGIFAGLVGLSQETLDEIGADVARYSFDRALSSLAWTTAMTHRLSLELRLGAEVVKYGNGAERGGDPPIEDVYQVATIPGFDEGMRLARLGATLVYDRRDPGRYGTGFIGIIDSSLAEGIFDDPSHFLTGIAETRLQIGFEDRALLLRARVGGVQQLSTRSDVPFEGLLSVSGDQGLRAMPYGRLRGVTEVLGTIEYRWLLSAYLDAALFVDYGGAFATEFKDIGTSTLFPGGGLGLHLRGTRHRAYWTAPLGGGFQLAYSDQEGFRFLLSVGEW